MEAVPFSARVPDPYQKGIDGVVRLENDSLTIEFETIGLLGERSEVSRIQVPVGELRDSSLETGLMNTDLVLGVNRIELISDFPGRGEGALKLRIARKHRDLARRLTAALELRLSEIELARADDELGQLRAEE